MRSVGTAAFLLASALILLPGRAAAQDPEAPPPPPPPPQEVAPPPAPPPAPAQHAVARTREEQQSEGRHGEVRGSERRGRESDAPVNRAPERTADRGAEQPVRAPGSAGGASRREIVRSEETAAPAPAESAVANASDDQRGAQRRGAVRRPPSGDSGRRTTERAVPRAEAPAPPPTRTVVTRRAYPYGGYYPSYSFYYDPWAYNSFGIGYFYYAPWTWAPYSAYGNYGYGAAYPAYVGGFGFDVGSVRLKVKPRDAEVWVDGYYAGSVDDFDGVLQALKLDAGGYHIEIRKAGYQTLTFDVRVQPQRTITFRGDMKAVP